MVMTAPLSSSSPRPRKNPLVVAPDNIYALRELAVARGHTSWLRDLTYSHDSAFLITASNDKTIRLWDARYLFSYP